MSLERGDLVFASTGDYQGKPGYIVSLDDDVYQVMFEDENGRGVFEDLAESDLVLAEIVDEEEEAPEVPAFGISQREFEGFVQFMMTNVIDRVATTGPDRAMFGWQEFEDKDFREVLHLIMIKIEEAMAMFVQSYILVGRISAAMNVTGNESDG